MNQDRRFRFQKAGHLLALTAGMILAVSACTKKAATPAPVQPMDAKTMSMKKKDASKGDVWTCAMHPQIRENKPGRCPICGMQLVKVSHIQDEHSANGTPAVAPAGHADFSLSPMRQQMIGVKWGEVERKNLFKDIRAAGRLAYDPELYTAQSEYLDAIRQLERVKDSPITEVKHSAQRMVSSARLRLKVLGLSDAQIRDLGAKGQDTPNLLISKPGEDVWVYAEVYEMDLPYIHPGLSAEITAGFLGGERLAGKVVSVDRVINPTTRTAKVRILVPKAKVLLRPESYVDVVIHSPLGEQLTVPFDAIFDTGDHAWVFVGDGQGHFKPRLVQIRFHAGDDVAIASGVKSGEPIVTSANFLIDSESRLRGAFLGDGGSDSSGDGAAPKKSTPSCKKGEHWDVGMAMCMPDVGKAP